MFSADFLPKRHDALDNFFSKLAAFNGVKALFSEGFNGFFKSS